MSKTSLKDTLALLADASKVRVQPSVPAVENDLQGTYCYMPLSSLTPGKFQPRRHFRQNSLQELATSIARDGVLQPLIVRTISQDCYEIIAGERRWRASKLAGLGKVPVIIREVNDESALAFGILENLQRDNLNPIEEADAYKRLIEEFSLTHEEVSNRVGKSRAVITNSLRLLKLPEDVKNALIEGVIQVGHAKAIKSLPEEKMLNAFKEVCLKRLSVRQTEKLVQIIGTKNKVIPDNLYEDLDKLRKLERQLSNLYGLPVTIKCNKYGEGKAELRFDSIEEFEQVILDILHYKEVK